MPTERAAAPTVIATRIARGTGPTWVATGPRVDGIEPPPLLQLPPIPPGGHVTGAHRAPHEIAPELEAALLATLTRAPRIDEDPQLFHDRRDHELALLFTRLDAIQADHLVRRLDLERFDDAVARAFRGLTFERRRRLRAFLADTRRRQVPHLAR